MKALKQVITIEGREHLMVFGMRFLEIMGDKYSFDKDGIKLRGLHYATIMTELQVHNPVVVFNMIKAATENDPFLKDEQIEEYVFSRLEDEESEKALFDDFFDIFTKLPGASRYVKELTKSQVQDELLKDDKKTTKRTSK